MSETRLRSGQTACPKLLAALTLGTLALSAEEKITFEEPVSAQGNVAYQYCAAPATNKGVQFNATRIGVMDMSPSSPSHAMVKQNEDDVLPGLGRLVIKFTTGQQRVGVRVGLERTYEFAVSAVMRGYDSAGNLVVTSPALNLGAGPIAATVPLGVAAPSAVSPISRVEVESRGPAGEPAVEVIDDLTYTTIGPPCIPNAADTASPAVQILQPTQGQTLNNPMVLLDIRAQDADTGIARLQVLALGALNSVLQSYDYCGGGAFPSTCPGFPASQDVRANYWSFLPAGIRKLRVRAWDFANNMGQQDASVSMLVPGPNLNLWVRGVELTQGIQGPVLVAGQSRSRYATENALSASRIPLIAGKRTVVRVFPGIEGTTVPVYAARATLSCYTEIGMTPGSGTRCDGPLEAPLLNPDVVIDPNNDTIDQLRSHPASTWNFWLPPQWARPGQTFWLLAKVAPPVNIQECGAGTQDDCSDGANFYLLKVEPFRETAPLDIKPVFGCVRDPSDPDKPCKSLASSPGEAIEIALSLLLGKDWDGDGTLDAFFHTAYPIADGSMGVNIDYPDLSATVDGLPRAGQEAIMSNDRMEAFLDQICEQSHFHLRAYGDPRLYLALLPPPTGNQGVAKFDYPCAVVKMDLDPSRTAAENNYGTGGAGESRFTTHWDEQVMAHEIAHTFNIRHASCDHDEGSGDQECDPAPFVFPCPHGGICYGQTERDEPWVFHTFNMGVFAPSNGSIHAHDFISYGDGPRWSSPYNYRRIFNQLANRLAQSPGDGDGIDDAGAEMLIVSGRVPEHGGGATLRSVYRVAVDSRRLPDEGVGAFSLELQDSQGHLLVVRRFDPAQGSGPRVDRFRSFFEAVPFPASASRMILKRGAEVLLERTGSAKIPEVKILLPNAATRWTAGRQVIRWEASDGDGDPLQFAVEYSSDNGRHWRTLALNHVLSNLEVDAETLPGSAAGHALVRIRASDGFHTATVVSAGFTVLGRAPHVRILSPKDGAKLRQRQWANFIGGGLDVAEGTLEQSAYVWSSDRDGTLGQGHELRIRSLSPGRHMIKLSAYGTSHTVAVAAIQIDVVAEPNTQPVANAGTGQLVPVGAAAKLDGGQSFDPDGDTLTFSWRWVSGSGKPTFDAGSPSPRFVPKLPGRYVFELVVRDGQVSSSPSRVTIIAQ